MKEGVIKTIRLLCDYMKTKYVSKKHGGYNIFEDDKVRLCLDTYVWNIDVYVKKPNGEEVLVLLRSYTGYNQVYHPGKWEDHILDLRDKVLTAQEQCGETYKQQRRDEHQKHFGHVPDELDQVFESGKVQP